MAGWSEHVGHALALARDHIDTDQLIPARFMSTARSEGYGDFLLHDMRRDASGDLDPAFPLNRFVDVSVLVAGQNFGTGSSREAASYALIDAGIRAVVAESFGDIFAANAVNNGLLPAKVSAEDARSMMQLCRTGPTATKINLPNRSVTIADHTFAFSIDPAMQEKLIQGWDDIDLTLQRAGDIRRFKDTRSRASGWAWPATSA